MPEFKRMSLQEIKASQEKVRALFGKKKQKPVILMQETWKTANEIKNEIAILQKYLTHATKFGQEKKAEEFQKQLETLQKQLTNLESKRQ